MNKRWQQLTDEGYQYTGATFSEWKREKANARLAEVKKECKPFGSKATLIREVEVNGVRDSSSKSVWLSIYIQYSEIHKLYLTQQNELRREESRKSYLQYLVNHTDGMTQALTLEDIQYMLNFKLDEMKKTSEVQ